MESTNNSNWIEELQEHELIGIFENFDEVSREEVLDSKYRNWPMQLLPERHRNVTTGQTIDQIGRTLLTKAIDGGGLIRFAPPYYWES